MEPANATARLGAYTSLTGALTMLIGAAFWGASGTDLWMALDQDDLAGYLSATADVKPLLVANLSLWTIGVLLIGVAGAALVRLCRQRPAMAQVARLCYETGVPLAVVAFVAMLSLVIRIGPEPSAAGVQVAEVIGWIGARADDLATALLIGAGPFFLALAGRGEWMPEWLVGWGFLAGAAGLLSMIALFLTGMTVLHFVIVPIGMGWLLAVSVVLFRYANMPEQVEVA